MVLQLQVVTFSSGWMLIWFLHLIGLIKCLKMSTLGHCFVLLSGTMSYRIVTVIVLISLGVANEITRDSAILDSDFSIGYDFQVMELWKFR